MPSIAVRASRNSNCEAPVAAMIRALPLLCIALQRETAACSAAARPREDLSSYTLMTIGQSQHDGKRSTHDHLARIRWNSTRFEHRIVLIYDRIDSIQSFFLP